MCEAFPLFSLSLVSMWLEMEHEPNLVFALPWSGRYPGEGNGTHSSILAWRLPWTEEPGGLRSMGSQKSWT